MLHLEQPAYLWLLLGVPVFILLFWLVSRQIAQQRQQFGAMIGLARLAPEVSTTKRPFKFGLLLLGYVFLVLALANPQMGSKTQSIQRQGVDVFIALDISSSMWAEDIKPNRMERARQLAQKIVQSLKGDRIGLILFAGQAYLQMPLTVDYAAAEMFVRTASPDLEITQGTAIEKAIDLVVELGEQDDKPNQRAIVVITDGENHNPAAVTAARDAKEKGITTYLVGAGTTAGAPIPVEEYGRRQYKLDKQGNVVQSKMNLTMLQAIADAGGGQLMDISQPDKAISQLRQQFSKLEKSEFENQNFDIYDTYYQYFVVIALFLLLVEFLVGYQRNKWLR